MGNCLCSSVPNLDNADNNVETLNDLFSDKLLYGKVVNIYDGDTCKVVCNYPIKSKSTRFPCRMFGYDSPEMKPLKTVENREEEIAAAKEAKGHLSNILSESKGKVWIYSRGLDKYGRLLAVFYKTKNDAVKRQNSINDRMINDGHGTPYFGGTKEQFGSSSSSV